MSTAVRSPPRASLKAAAVRCHLPRIAASGVQSRPRIFSSDPKRDNAPRHEEETDGLLPEEDWTVPGGPNDSLSSNTQLGRAVRSAAEELEHLSKLEEEILNEAYELLEKLITRKGKADDLQAS